MQKDPHLSGISLDFGPVDFHPWILFHKVKSFWRQLHVIQLNNFFGLNGTFIMHSDTRSIFEFATARKLSTNYEYV